MDRSGSTEGSPQAEHAIPKVEDPRVFMEGFYKSDYFRDAYKKFYEGKKLAPDVTEDEKHQAFLDLGGDQLKFALVDYGKHDANLRYNPEFYSKEAVREIANYIEFVRDFWALSREGDRTVEDLDDLRAQYHSAAADALVKDGIVPNQKLGRVIVRLVLIDKKLETFDDARVEDIIRIKRKIGGF